ncbi:10397_t:CDS:2, partial [Gigaspora margarita]
ISPIPRSSTEATLSFITPRRPIPSLSNLAVSPILRREGISSFITHQSITTRLEPEDLDNPFSLPPYNEDTTVINFPPRRNSLPNSPLVDIPLRTPSRIPSSAPTTASSPNSPTRFINFIIPSRLSNPPPPHRTLFTNVPSRLHYPPPLIINPNTDPIHPPDTVYPIHPEETDPVPPIPTPEAPLVNQLDPINEAPLPLLPAIQNPPLPNNMVQAQALTEAANAINTLAVALGQAMAYMKDNAQEWASSLANAPNHFQHDNHGQNDQN